VIIFGGRPAIDFSAATVTDYSMTYTDPNDPFSANYDVRWAVITTVSSGNAVSKRFLLAAKQKGNASFSVPVTLDTMVEK
jgi:hypothetical protein